MKKVKRPRRPLPPRVKEAVAFARRLEYGFQLLNNDGGTTRPRRKRGRRDAEAIDED